MRRELEGAGLKPTIYLSFRRIVSTLLLVTRFSALVTSLPPVVAGRGEMPYNTSVMIEILTIGHSNHDVIAFLEILNRHNVEVLVDIRSDPYSRYASQFNKSDFERQVEAAGITYRYSGAYVGGRPKDPSLTPLPGSRTTTSSPPPANFNPSFGE